MFIPFPDCVHWQKKRSVRKTLHQLWTRVRRRMLAPGRVGNRRHQPRRIDKTKENGDESFQTYGAQGHVARDDRDCDDAAWLDALLQSAGSEWRAVHGDGRGRRLPGESASKEARDSTDRSPLHSIGAFQSGSRPEAEYASSSSQAQRSIYAGHVRNRFSRRFVRTVVGCSLPDEMYLRLTLCQ